MKVHKGRYESDVFGGRIFVYAFTLCRGEAWSKTTPSWSKVTCKRCKTKKRKQQKIARMVRAVLPREREK